MPRKKGSKNKPKPKKIETETHKATIESDNETPSDVRKKEDRLITLDAAARMLGVNSVVARLWFDHGHLKGINNLGYIRVSKQSVLNCKFRKNRGSKHERLAQ